MENKNVLWIVVLILAVVFLVLLIPSGMGTMHGRGWGGMMGWHGMGFGGAFMWLIGILIIGLVIYLIIGGGTSAGKREDEALRILKNRLAKGEITKEEYEELKRKLEE